jgi:hypothetical protein
MTANLCKSSMRDNQQQSYCDDKPCYQTLPSLKVKSTEQRWATPLDA